MSYCLIFRKPSIRCLITDYCTRSTTTALEGILTSGLRSFWTAESRKWSWMAAPRGQHRLSLECPRVASSAHYCSCCSLMTYQSMFLIHPWDCLQTTAYCTGRLHHPKMHVNSNETWMRCNSGKVIGLWSFIHSSVKSSTSPTRELQPEALTPSMGTNSKKWRQPSTWGSQSIRNSAGTPI